VEGDGAIEIEDRAPATLPDAPVPTRPEGETVLVLGTADPALVASCFDHGATRVVVAHPEPDVLERLDHPGVEVAVASPEDQAAVEALVARERPDVVLWRSTAPPGGPGPAAWLPPAAASAGCTRVVHLVESAASDRTGDAPWAPPVGPVGVDPERSDASLQAALSNERASAEHLRRVNAQQAAQLRRRSVRAALGVDRRLRRVTRELERRRVRVTRRVAQATIAAGAVPGRAQVASRRAALDAALADLPPAPAVGTRSVSVVVVTDRALASPPPVPPGVELVVVRTSARASVPAGVEHVDVRIDWKAEAAAAARGVQASGGELVCLLGVATEVVGADWLDRLVDAVAGDVVATTPLVVHPARPLRSATPHDLLVRQVGLDIEVHDDRPVPRARGAGSVPDPFAPPAEVAAGSAACMVFHRRAYEDAGGLAPLGDLDAALVELCGRLRTAGGRILAVPAAVVVDHRPVRSLDALVHPVEVTGPAWQTVLERQGPALVQLARGDAVTDHLSFVISVGAPAQRVAGRWGDWHLAQALARSLRRLGHVVRVQSVAQADDAASRACDVHLLLRGKAPVRRTSGQRHVLWVISHPESVSTEECDEADLVLVASERFAADLRGRTTTPVHVLQQATDHRRFRPRPPDPHHAHAVAVVANTRGEFRPVVADALTAGLRPAIYGKDWERYVDPQLIVAETVPNEDLPVVYSSVGVLLNDHWDTMKAWGFVSNRLFDALACGTPVISDHLPEVRDLFGDAVATYRTPGELAERVSDALADPVAARRRAEEGRRRVLAEHTFDVRARQLLEAMARCGLDRRSR
jgi:glycosyltransferase involved in cell wall biosynthesis